MAVVEAPDGIAGAGIERERGPGAVLHAPLMALREPAERREVDEPVQDRRRPHDPSGSVEAPAEVTRSRVDGREVPVPGPDEHHVPPDRRRRVDVRPRPTGPEQMSGRRPVCVDGSVRIAEEDAAVSDRGRGVEVLSPAESRERFRTPALSPGACIERVDTSSEGAYIDHSIRVGGRSGDLLVGPVAPDEPVPLSADVERVHPAIPRAEVEDAADQQRR